MAHALHDPSGLMYERKTGSQGEKMLTHDQFGATVYMVTTISGDYETGLLQPKGCPGAPAFSSHRTIDSACQWLNEYGWLAPTVEDCSWLSD